MLSFLIFALGWALVFFAGSALADQAQLFDHRTIAVALDPGHGGQDDGARGPTGLLEKAVVLDLARRLALTLEADYRVTLTRSGDHYVEPRQRTAIANHAKADLMISLHTGASFRHTTLGQAIYYHIGSSGTATTENENHDNGAQRLWHQAQVRHVQASQALAHIIKQQLGKVFTNIPCQIKGAPLVVLQGADQPAILIELGHITHPKSENALASPKHLELLAKSISHGINQFLDQAPPLDSP